MLSEFDSSADPVHPPHQLGRRGEEAAARYLVSCNYALLDRNWRGSVGEIDLIALADGVEIVFVEVKTRGSLRFGDPFDAITPEKYRRIYQLAREWIALHHPRAPWRIDVILLLKRGAHFDLTHRKGLIA